MNLLPQEIVEAKQVNETFKGLIKSYYGRVMKNKAKQFGALAPLNIDLKEKRSEVESHIQKLQKKSEVTTAEKVAVWCSYFTLVFTAIGGFMPQTASAAIMSVQGLLG